MMLVVGCARRFLTLPPEAIRSGRLFALPPEIVYSLWVPAPLGYECFLYIEEEPWALPADAPSLFRRAFWLDCA